METLKSPKPEFLWSTFYEGFFEDINRDLPENQKDLDSVELHVLERRFGARLYYQLLPELGKLMERSLATDDWFELPAWLRCYVDYSGYPRFLLRFWRTAFFVRTISITENRWELMPIHDIRDRDNEKVVHEAAYAVYVLRQALLAFSKIEDVEPEIDKESELNEFIARITLVPEIRGSRVLRLARILIRAVVEDSECFELSDCEMECNLAPCLAQWDEDPFGLHGPGAVAGGERSWQKWLFKTIHGLDSRVYQYLPKHAWDTCALAKDLGRAGEYPPRELNFFDEGRTSVLAVVPKDFRGHRLICIEPKELQFAQQGLMRVLYKHFQSHWLTRSAISFRNQAKSQILSRNLKFATIDLKDASDRLSISLARILFPRAFFQLVTRYRSDKVMLPDSTLVQLKALATMGSALCFPLETLTFWAISLAAMLVQDDLDEGGTDYRFLWDKEFPQVIKHHYHLRVFGDDIIVPRRFVTSVVNALEGSGLVVNRGKTFIDGLARESCGDWSYGSVDVRIVRFKASRLSGTHAWLGLAENCKALNESGMTRSAQAVLEFCSRLYPLPYGKSGFPNRKGCLNLLVHPKDEWYRENRPAYRWNKNLQRLEFRMPVICEDNKGERDLPGNAGLYAWFVGKSATKTPLHQGHPCVKWCWTRLEP